MLVVHEEKCTGCGNCVAVCPVNVEGKRMLDVKDGIVRIVDMSLCMRLSRDPTLRECKECNEVCPVGAIEVC